MTSPKKQLTASAVVTALVGGIVAGFNGYNLLIPLVAGALLWFVGVKIIAPTDPRYLQGIAVQFGHLTWFLAGSVLLGAWSQSFLDLLLLAVGIIWLWFRPGIWPVLLLAAYQLFAMAINLHDLAAAPYPSPLHSSLSAHVALRVFALYTLGKAYFGSRNAHATTG